METGSFESLEISRFIKARAASLGFCLCGITDASPLDHFSVYQNWIRNNMHGEMQYLASEWHFLRRQDPRSLAPWVRSIIVLAWPYTLTRINQPAESGMIAGYTAGEDYHQLIPRQLEQLASSIEIRINRPVKYQIFTDSSPVLERELAVRAGLGWIGRNSCLITPQHGSAVLLAELFVDLDLPIDPPFTQDFCGICQRCVETCPTRCIQGNRTIDARKCISTLTIENKGLISTDMLTFVGNHLFGCDDCQAVCPWNKKRTSPDLAANSLSLEEMIEELSLSENRFKEKYAGSPIMRAKRRGWLRNVCVALGNLGQQNSFTPLVEFFLAEKDIICRISAARAIFEIDKNKAIPLITRAIEKESNPILKKELAEVIK